MTNTVNPPPRAVGDPVGFSGAEATIALKRARWGTIPIALVIVLLLGSVLIPARQTWRIMHLLRETGDVVEPARLHAARVESGLMAESAALEAFALTDDPVQLARFRAAAADDDGHLDAVETLAQRLDAEAIERVAAVRAQVRDWRETSRVLVDGRLPRAEVAAAVRAHQTSYEPALREVTRLAGYLSAEGTTRRDLIGGSERLGLLVNASLVFVALAAVIAVGALSYRERRLTRILRRRIEEEEALGAMAQQVGAAATTEEVMRRLTEGAAWTTLAAAAYVECIAFDGEMVEYALYDRDRSSLDFARRPRAGSVTEAIIARGSTGLIIETDSRWMIPDRAGDGRARAGLLVPLSSSGQTFGVVLILQERAAGGFGEHTRRQMHTVADLASAALHRVMVHAAEARALQEAQGRAKQEVALREAAEALTAAFTVDEVTQQIARTALEATPAQGAFVEEIVAPTGEEVGMTIVRAATGQGVPTIGSRGSFVGSCMELVLERREPILIPDLTVAEPSCMAARTAEAGCSAIAVPLGNASSPIGALFLVSASRTPFVADDLTRAHTFGHLAGLAYEKVRLLEEAREGRQELERVMSSRSRLMRGFSHDVKNPLGAADGYAALLSEGILGPLAATQADSIRRIRTCIHTALGLIDDLHELARAETGNIVLSPQLVDLSELACTSGDEYRAAAEACGLSLRTEAGPDPLLVETDPARVRQIVSNLLSNAIKYSAEGAVVLRVRREPPAPVPGESWAVVEVSDAGRGIPPEKLDVIFEEFIRVGNDEKSGAGLGLAISQKLAHALDGRITVRSEVGHGSTFTLWLPIRKPERSLGAPATTMNGEISFARIHPLVKATSRAAK